MQIVTIDNFLSKEECKSILDYSLSNLKLKEGRIGINNLSEVNLYRKSNIAFDNYNEFPYLLERVKNIVDNHINIKGFNIDFDNKKFQFTKYTIGDYYDWHTDTLDESINDRYCSIVIELNNNYMGGILEIKDIKLNLNNLGKLYMFPSNILHRVTMVTHGTRYSLVMWLHLIKKLNYSKSLI